MQQGYIKLYRSLLNWEWFEDINVFRLFIFCLLRANHKTEKWQGITINKGSFVTSYEKLAISTGLTIRQVRTALNKLKTTGELTNKTTSQYSIITVKNWNLYQANDMPNDKQMTNERQTNDKRATTNNNEKNNKKEKEINKEKEKITPTLEEIENYCKERNNNVDAKRFFDYYNTANWQDKDGKPIKNWKQKMIAVWEPKDQKRAAPPEPKPYNPYYNAELDNVRMYQQYYNEVNYGSNYG